MTKEKFIPNKFGAGRLYRTGDLGYWNEDGTIQFVSRIDKQVKIRGFRIELKEIEAKILEFGNIRECAVVVTENNFTQMLVACIGTKNNLNTKELNTYLKTQLPFYMIPQKYMVMENLPLNINGKLDSKKLLEELSDISEDIVKPTNEIQEGLAQIWKEVLGIESIGIDQSFFEIGGDSLSAIKLISLINLKYDIQITIKTLFDKPTIQDLELYIKNNDTTFDKELKDNSKETSDYSEINELLSKNNINNFINPKEQNIGNLLLLGSTGFLGAHILSSYLDNEKGIVYCIVRSKRGKSSKERLTQKLHFYFGNKYDEIIDNRLKIIEGDIILENMGLNNEDYQYLGENVDTVINSAAIVKHYGKKQIFENINVKGTNNIINFCEKFNKKFLHCSTLSLTRDLIKHQDDINELQVFSEDDFYFDQNLNNVYINTKFRAEKLVYEARLRGLNACCLRIGNISNRYSDGMFQENIKENAILAKLKSFIDIGYIPDYLLDLSFDFTPVDICSDAILKIANTDIQYSTFHIVNSNIILMKELLDIFKKELIEVIPVPEQEFMKIFENIRQDKSKRDMLLGIIQDWIRDKEFKYYYSVTFNSDFTDKYLESIGFIWPNVDEEYFRKYINYLRNIGYIGGEK